MTATLFLRLLGLLTSLGFGYLVFDYTAVEADARHAVSGGVQIDGRPLSHGSIRFLSTADSRWIGSAAEVVNGEYEISEEDGLNVGKYQVCISGVGLEESYRANCKGGAAMADLKDCVPARFNQESELMVEVTKDGNILGFDFDLK